MSRSASTRFISLILRSLLFCAVAVTAAQQAPAPAGLSSSPSQASPEPAISDQLAVAETAITASDWKTAEAKLDAYLVTHPADGRALFDAGYVADAQDRLDDAESLYRRSTAADPKSFEAHLSLGLLLARRSKTAEGRSELETATSLEPGQAGPELKARAWRALARIDRDTDPSRASTDLLEALKLSPETPSDTLLAAGLAEQSGHLDDAEKEYRKVLATDTQSVPANAGLAHILIGRKNYPEAETLLRAALDQAPGDPTLTAQLATVLADQDKAEALPMLQQLHSAHPSDAAITRMLAEVTAVAGDYAGSDRLVVQLLTANPKDAALLVQYGQNLVHQAQFAQAYAVFDQASQADPTSPEAWSGLAFAASRIGKPDVTLNALASRSSLAPESASTLFLWATAYDSLHQKDQAAAYYRRFLDAAGGKFPNQEWQARQRLQVLGK